jgi:hypothetical protein
MKYETEMTMMDDASERLQVLLSQECTTYKTSDYLTNIHETEEVGSAAVPTSDSHSHVSSQCGTKKRKMLPNGDGNCIHRGTASSSLETMGNDEQVHSSHDEKEHEELRRRKHWREKMCEWAYQGR